MISIWGKFCTKGRYVSTITQFKYRNNYRFVNLLSINSEYKYGVVDVNSYAPKLLLIYGWNVIYNLLGKLFKLVRNIALLDFLLDEEYI